MINVYPETLVDKETILKNLRQIIQTIENAEIYESRFCISDETEEILKDGWIEKVPTGIRSIEFSIRFGEEKPQPVARRYGGFIWAPNL